MNLLGTRENTVFYLEKKTCLFLTDFKIIIKSERKKK